MTYDLITIGDIKLDTFVVLPEASIQCTLKMPECLLCLTYGKKIPVTEVDAQIAGSAPNVARGISRLGGKTAIVSILGTDGTRKLAFDVLKEEGVDTRFIQTSKKATSSFSVVLTYKGERTILASHLPDVYRLPRLPKDPHWLFLSELGQGYTRLFREIKTYVKRQDVLLGFNPGAVQIQEAKKELFDLIRISKVVFVNREEARVLTQEQTSEIHRLTTSLYKMGPSIVVITNGKEGAYAFDGKHLLFCPIFPAPLVEATGAGDAFATGFLGSLMHKQEISEALRWGAVNAASVVGFVGPTKGLLTLSQIRSRLGAKPTFKTKSI